ncbi:MAG: DUF4178 domain-containing protein [Pyrinomonadaceae bacterium]
MSVLKANCPSCAAPIEFKAGSSIVLICPFCRSAVARTDRRLEDLGRVAEIAQSQSPLKVGLKGEYAGNRFELTGRAQIKHDAGGFWDEWYATFSNGWTGWLAEAQGRFYMTFYKPFPSGVLAPDFHEVVPGQRFENLSSETPLVVQEKGTASYTAAEGEIPYKLDPTERTNYIDLAGKNNIFATIDYGTNPPFLFYGKEVTLADLGLAEKKSAEREAPIVGAASMGCPKCGGALELRVPDKSERVTCPFCDSLLDVKEGNLRYLTTLKKRKLPLEFKIEVGAKGAFGQFAKGAEFEVIGSMTRSVVIDGTRYYWNEYLLYNPRIGFRWLVESDNHWSFAENVNPAEVEEKNTGVLGKQTVTYNGRNFRIFQDSPAKVEYVKGEFYWRVEVGEQVKAADYVAPPLMLSKEVNQKEISWSLSTYVDKKDVERAFKLEWLPEAINVGPNQPFLGGGTIKVGFLLLGLLVLSAIVMLPFSGFETTPLNEEYTLEALPGPSSSKVIFSKPFKLQDNKNVRITGLAPVNNSWAELNIDLVNQTNSEVEAVIVPIEYYHGVSDGESWSEGGQSYDATISSVPAGEYKLRIEGSWQAWNQPMPIRVKVEQNVTRGVNFCLAFVLLAVVPVISLLRRFSFESRRWSESMFSTSSDD